MLKHSISISIICCHLLADFIDFEDNKMIKFCSTCCRHSCVCKVHFRFESCNECLRCNQKYNVRVIENEWKKLKVEKFKLRQRICDALAAQKKIRKAEDKAVFDCRVALIKEMRLCQ